MTPRYVGLRAEPRLHARLSRDCRCQLLELLKKFSTNFETRSRALLDSLHELEFDATATQVSVHNTLNQFLLLSNTQFIENVSAGARACCGCPRSPDGVCGGGGCWMCAACVRGG